MYNNVPEPSFDAKRLTISIHITKIHILILEYFKLYENTEDVANIPLSGHYTN